MKRFLIAILVLVLCLSVLAACGDKGATANDGPATYVHSLLLLHLSLCPQKS